LVRTLPCHSIPTYLQSFQLVVRYGPKSHSNEVDFSFPSYLASNTILKHRDTRYLAITRGADAIDLFVLLCPTWGRESGKTLCQIQSLSVCSFGPKTNGELLHSRTKGVSRVVSDAADIGFTTKVAAVMRTKPGTCRRRCTGDRRRVSPVR